MVIPNYYQQYSPYGNYTPYPQQNTQFVQQNSPSPASFSCRPVTSREEAVAAQVDFFGPGTIMPDLGHGLIYLKRFNQQTGSCDIVEFTVQENKQVKYATVEDLAALKSEILKEMLGNDAE